VSESTTESPGESLADTTQIGGTPNSPESPTGGVDGPVTRKIPATGVDPVEANVLYADHITIRFGGLTAVGDVSFAIPPRSVVSLIGPNGAGKTTFFNVLTGLYAASEGAVYLNGKDITAVKPHKRASMGLARTFQNIRLFGLMTAEENVMVAMHSHLRSGVISTIIRTPGQRREERAARDTARELLDYVGIGKTVGELARNLSYGDQRRLEIARAMALQPQVLLLDEPTAGMNPQESANFNDFVYRVRDEKGISVLLIEHDMSVIMKISERITVLDRGSMIAEGTPDDIRNNQMVIEAYLGKTGTREGKRRPATAAKPAVDGEGQV
jgi:branched-chain amino acid transport system ATP-binding protein